MEEGLASEGGWTSGRVMEVRGAGLEEEVEEGAAKGKYGGGLEVVRGCCWREAGG